MGFLSGSSSVLPEELLKLWAPNSTLSISEGWASEDLQFYYALSGNSDVAILASFLRLAFGCCVRDEYNQ